MIVSTNLKPKMKKHVPTRKPRRGDPQIPADAVTNQMVAEISRLYTEASHDDQFALRVWMRDIILGRKAGKGTWSTQRGSKSVCSRRVSVGS